MSFLLSKIFICLLLALAIGLIVGWLLRRFSALAREAELNQEIGLRDDQVTSLEGQVGDRDGKIMALGSDLDSWKGKVPKLEASLSERDDQLVSLTMDRDGWKQKVPTLENQLRDVTDQRTKLSADLNSRGMALEASEAEVARLTQELKTSEEALAERSRRLAEESARLTSELADQRQKFDVASTELTGTRNRAEEAVARGKVLDADIIRFKQQNETLSAESREREKALDALREQLKSQEAERNSLAQQLTAMSPIAARVDSQDQTIASLNLDLRARDTSIRGLRGELAGSAAQAEELKSSQRSLELLRSELNGMRGELDLSKTQLATQLEANKAAEVKQSAAGSDREWRSRLRIAESGRQQVQAELYRQQEQVKRLENQLAQSGGAGRGAAAGAGAVAGAAAVGLASSSAAADPAPRVALTNEGEWRSRVRIAESARQRAELESRRQNEQVLRLEAQLREARNRPAPGQQQALAKSTAAVPAAAQAKAAQPTPTSRTAPTPPAAAPAASAGSSSGSRFLTAPPPSSDDLRKIKGVGKVLQKTLNDLGIYQYAQVARFTDEDVAWVDDRLKFKGRITRDNWIGQANDLHKEKYGSEPRD